MLSAFGCGRLGNPAESTAKLFKQVILSDYMGGNKQPRTFTEIVFAITNHPGSDGNAQGNDNYSVFKRVMESSEDADEDTDAEP